MCKSCEQIIQEQIFLEELADALQPFLAVAENIPRDLDIDTPIHLIDRKTTTGMYMRLLTVVLGNSWGSSKRINK